MKKIFLLILGLYCVFASYSAGDTLKYKLNAYTGKMDLTGPYRGYPKIYKSGYKINIQNDTVSLDTTGAGTVSSLKIFNDTLNQPFGADLFEDTINYTNSIIKIIYYGTDYNQNETGSFLKLYINNDSITESRIGDALYIFYWKMKITVIPNGSKIKINTETTLSTDYSMASYNFLSSIEINSDSRLIIRGYMGDCSDPEICPEANYATIAYRYIETPGVIVNIGSGGEAVLNDVHDTADILRSDIHDTADVLRSDIHDTADVLRSNIHDTADVLRSNIHDTADVLRSDMITQLLVTPGNRTRIGIIYSDTFLIPSDTILAGGNRTLIRSYGTDTIVEIYSMNIEYKYISVPYTSSGTDSMFLITKQNGSNFKILHINDNYVNSTYSTKSTFPVAIDRMDRGASIRLYIPNIYTLGNGLLWLRVKYGIYKHNF